MLQSHTLAQLRAAFINASRREASQATPTVDLDTLEWDNLDVFGWKDPHNPQRAYALLPVSDERAVAVLLTAVPAPPRKAMCALCEDITEVSDVRMFIAKAAGAAGRKGDTLGTLIHADFSCSKNARRFPSRLEGQDDPQAFIANRVGRLQSNVQRFAKRVLGEA